MPEVSLIIPVFNEARRLEASLQEVVRYLSTVAWSHEVIVVVEKSSDGSLALAERSASAHGAIQVIANEAQRGKGFAVRCGMQKATGSISFFMDADLSTPLAEIGRFLEFFALHPEVDVCIGNRQHPGSQILESQGWLRRGMGQIFNAILRRITHLPYLDTQCGFKGFRAEARAALFARQTVDGFAFDGELLLLARQLGLIVADLPVQWRNSAGSKVHMCADSVRMLRDTWQIARRLAESNPGDNAQSPQP